MEIYSQVVTKRRIEKLVIMAPDKDANVQYCKGVCQDERDPNYMKESDHVTEFAARDFFAISR